MAMPDNAQALHDRARTQICQLVTPDSVLCNAHARSKKHCLEILSELLAGPVPNISSEEIFEGLISRERLGSTSLDEGVAFPHCRVEDLDRSVGALVKLSEPVDCESPDGQQIDLIFGLAIPGKIDSDLQGEIAGLAELLSDTSLRSRLRAARTSEELYEALCGS